MVWFKQRSGIRPEVESLEGRPLLSNILVVDFNPDRISGENRRAEAFMSPFGRRINGHSPRFLDFNHDGRVSAGDLGAATDQVLLRTARYLTGFDVVVVPGDVGRNTNLGQRLLHLGYVTGNPTYVLYVGGRAFDGSADNFGEAFQAPVGFNYQYYAFAYSTTMAEWYQAHRPDATPEEFAQDLALTVAHEFAHLLGLGHPVNSLPDDNSIMNGQVDPNSAVFPDRMYPQVTLYGPDQNPFIGPQSPAAELRASLQGQPAFSTAGLFYSTGSASAHRDRERAPDLPGHHTLRHRPHPG